MWPSIVIRLEFLPYRISRNVFQLYVLVLVIDIARQTVNLFTSEVSEVSLFSINKSFSHSQSLIG